jgi:hypothetical protein
MRRSERCPDEGGTIDARGFAPNQTCNATINASKPVTIQFGAGMWVLKGNPGINVTAPNVVIACPASAILQNSPTTLASGTAALRLTRESLPRRSSLSPTTWYIAPQAISGTWEACRSRGSGARG